MPVSKNRTNHRHRVEVRNKRINDGINRRENFYKKLYTQLETKPVSVPELLNQEDLIEEISDPIIMPEYDPNEPIYLSSQSVVLSDEEQAEQDRIVAESVVTTASTEI